jgi:hypothetical protein
MGNYNMPFTPFSNLVKQYVEISHKLGSNAAE